MTPAPPPATSPATSPATVRRRPLGPAPSRRRFLSASGLAVLGLGAAGCGGGGSDRTASGGSTRTFRDAFGEVEVPVTPQRVACTTDQNALLPLLEVGFRPVASAGLLDEATGEQVFRRTEGFDTSGIEWLGPYGEANAEAFAAVEPDLIVGYEFDDQIRPVLQDIAPFVGVQVFGRPLSEVLMDFADLVGRLDRAEELRGAYEARVDAVRARYEAFPVRPTISVVASFEPGTFGRGFDDGQSIGTVLADVGVVVPAPQQGEQPEAPYSVETVGEHDADVMLLVDFGGDGGDGEPARAFQESPLVQRLEAVRRGQLVVVDGTTTVGSAWARMDAVLDVLEEVLSRPGLVVTGLGA